MKKQKVKKIIVILICLMSCIIFIQQIMYYSINKNIKSLGLDKEYDNISVVKSFEGRLSKEKEDKIISTIVRGLGGGIIDKKGQGNQKKIYAYTPILKNVVAYNDEEINLNIIITYMEDLDVSNVYIGFPIVNIDY